MYTQGHSPNPSVFECNVGGARRSKQPVEDLHVIRAESFSAGVPWSAITMRMALCGLFDPRLRERDKGREHNDARDGWFIIRPELLVPRP
jgi:hypothetical protein